MLVPFPERLFSGQSSKKKNFQAKTRKLNPLRSPPGIIPCLVGESQTKPTGFCDLSSHSAKNRAWHGLLCMDKHRNQRRYASHCTPPCSHHHSWHHPMATPGQQQVEWTLVETCSNDLLACVWGVGKGNPPAKMVENIRYCQLSFLTSLLTPC